MPTRQDDNHERDVLSRIESGAVDNAAEELSALIYASEQLTLAVHAIATSTEKLQLRVADAFNFRLGPILQAVREQLPGDIRIQLEEVETAIDRVPIPDDRIGLRGVIVKKMRKRRAFTLIERILHIYNTVNERLPRGG